MAPWKQFFGTLWGLSYCIPVRKWRNWIRSEKLFGYGDKLNALRRTFPDLDWKHFRLAKGGGSLAFIVGGRVFKIRKFHQRDDSVQRFNREKRITDGRILIFFKLMNTQCIRLNLSRGAFCWICR